ncbi:DNA primase small subunit PriS [Halorussus sp. MSC15.2]|uniref:DNA primase small subunit PriS n=1 Tax=Halorussus sp. MSC15.2 TaxID=2283638 RepID=UPI0013D34E3B|nr:DNA primase small subunit PriS [Halorussus sp. MSC15.2]NEU56164.1 DNA primase small subunit PriS [Halorussus sp. MSC15.2]
MEERTRAYLRGRFRDHYRRKEWLPESSGDARGSEETPPPDPEAREWGYIPWTSGATTMVRHQSLLELGELGDFLQRERPRHVYFSAGRYEDPGADEMEAKGWRDSDLVFDIDADHLEGVDPQRDAYGEMLAAGKEEVQNLLDLLENDFGFSDLTVVFSGGRGYHVHVRDEGVRGLNRDERREIVDYIRGEGIERDAIQRVEMGGTATRRVLKKDGGWGRRVHRELLSLADELLAMEDDDALERLKEFDGIGDGRAQTILGAVSEDYEKLESGNVERGGQGIRELTKVMTQKVVAEQSAAIDEPVTTDLRRLIRLPGSLHGGTGLEVTRIPRDEVADFDPLSDPVPETFEGHEVTVEVTDPGPVELRGESFTLSAGDVSLPEYVAVFLMARGRAEKGRE